MLHLLAASSSQGSSPIGLLLPLLLVVAFFFLFIRPQRRRQRQATDVQASLQPGVEVMTTAGLFGTIRSIDDEAVVLEVAPGVSLRFLRGAVARVVTPTGPDVATEVPPDDRPAV